MELGRIVACRLTGDESFIGAGDAESFSVLDYWRWSNSDLVSNASRGILAEYIVGKALGCDVQVRDEWATYDLLTPERYRVEVKSSAYLQSWHQKKLSTITFGYGKRRGWDSETGTEEAEPLRNSDVYVFALLAHQDQSTLNPLDLAQWKFYVVPTAWLDARERSQHSITLPSLRSAFDSVMFCDLRDAVASAVEAHRRMQAG